MDDVLKRLTAIFCQVLGNPAINLSEEYSPDDVEGWDSMSHFEMVAAVEEDFSIRILSDEIRKIKTVGDFVRIIKSKRK